MITLHNKRFRDALDIQGGACNPSGVALALYNACLEAMAVGKGTKQVCEDAAVRLIAHQLSFLLNIRAIDESLTEYGRLTDICRKMTFAKATRKELDAMDAATRADYRKRRRAAARALRKHHIVDTALEEGTRYERAFGDRYE